MKNSGNDSKHSIALSERTPLNFERHAGENFLFMKCTTRLGWRQFNPVPISNWVEKNV